jgi:hypothetical protein
VAGLCDICDPTVARRVRHKKEEQVAVALEQAGIRIMARDKILAGEGCYAG